MSKSPLISLSGVGKDYPSLSTAGGRLRTIWSLLTGSPEYSHFSALKDISLEMYKGQSLGLIGENGAGKSTLLKIIAGVVKASSGTVAVSARIGALLELGAGFHPEYTGRDNIYLATALMGLSRQETESRIDSIMEFADIGEHIDQPIKHYSSGMVVRLGFAVATAMRPEVLITDEVLAVGDESFQKKCVNWMESYLADGGTLLLCSHSMFHIQKLCHKALWIHQGQAHQFGDASEVARDYLAYHEEKSARADKAATSALPVETGAHGVYALRELWLEDENHNPATDAMMGRDVLICGHIHSPDDRPPVVGIGVVKLDRSPIYGVVSDIDNFILDHLGSGLYGFKLRLQEVPLLPGHYIIRAHAMDPEGIRLFDTVECPLRITGQTRELGFCRLRHVWEGCGNPSET